MPIASLSPRGGNAYALEATLEVLAEVTRWVVRQNISKGKQLQNDTRLSLGPFNSIGPKVPRSQGSITKDNAF